MDIDDVDIVVYNGFMMVMVSGESEVVGCLEYCLMIEKFEVLVCWLVMNIFWYLWVLDFVEFWFRDGIGEIEW